MKLKTKHEKIAFNTDWIFQSDIMSLELNLGQTIKIVFFSSIESKFKSCLYIDLERSLLRTTKFHTESMFLKYPGEKISLENPWKSEIRIHEYQNLNPFFDKTWFANTLLAAGQIFTLRLFGMNHNFIGPNHWNEN